MSIEIDLSGNVALVTGANSPIGLAIASKLKKAGAELILAVHNNDDNVKSFTNSVPATILSADLRNPHEVEKLISGTLKVKLGYLWVHLKQQTYFTMMILSTTNQNSQKILDIQRQSAESSRIQKEGECIFKTESLNMQKKFSI